MKTTTVGERIKKTSERFFLTDPLLYGIYCTHNFIKNDALHFPMRTGKMRIEYSEKLLSDVKDSTIRQYLLIELIRILLKHPYQRQPLFPDKRILILASNITINDCYQIPVGLNCPGPGLFTLPEKFCFEEYYNEVFAILNNPDSLTKQSSINQIEGLGSLNSNSSQSENKLQEKIEIESNIDELAELWEENEDSCIDINNLIEIAEESNGWGTLSGDLQTKIQASLKVEMDYRRMLRIFKASVISSKRKLTRMKPNRRYGFAAMGSKYELAINLLIAVDVSGSVTNESLQYFFSVINRFFNYGIEKLDVIQFDYEIKTKKPISLKKAKIEVNIKGRGGTDFQCVADFYSVHSEYDGLIYFTDGYALEPQFNTSRRIDVLWILNDKTNYNNHKEWIYKLPRNRATYIPMPEDKKG